MITWWQKKEMDTSSMRERHPVQIGEDVPVTDYRFDYALNSLSSLGLTHRITVNVGL
jgi:hypothetical protein